MTFFYNLNKTLDAIREKPELKHGQLNERANNKPVEEGLGDVAKKVGSMAKKVGGKVLDKLGHGSDEDMIRDLQKKAGVPQTGKKPMATSNEGVDKQAFAALAPPKDKITFADKIAGAKKEVDEMLGDVAAEAMKNALTGGQKKLDKNKNGKLDANDFAMLRKGGKKEVADEGSTGDYSAKKARAGKDIGKPGKGFAKIAKGAAERYGSKAAGERVAGAVLNKLRHKGANESEMDEGWDDMLKDVERRRSATKKGEITHGHKHDIEDTGTGRRVTRRTDPNTGYSVGAEDDKPADGEKRGRGRPKKTDKKPERVTAKATKHKGGRKTNEGADEGSDLVKLSKVIASCTTKEQLEAARKMAQNFLSKHASGEIGFAGGKLRQDIGRRNDVVATIKQKNKELGGNTELDEKAVSKKQQKFMGMVHATQKGEKAPSKEVAKVAKTMKKKDAEDFASTKHKGLPEKKKPEGKKKEKTEEAGGSGTPTASSGFSFGQGIYDSMNHELENMIAESMSVNLSSDSEGQKNITVTASDEDALKLAAILKSAGLGGSSDEGYGGTGYKSACGCGQPDCSCGDEEVDEAAPAVNDNSPDWPTNQETAQDNLEYSGGLNKPKSTGQTTVPVIASQEERQGTYAEAEEDAIKRMMEMAGIKEGKKPDFLDVDKDGNNEEPFKKAVDDKKEKKVDESILTATANLWTEYKGKYGV